jgi:predicted flap endonuclease-1-like 5' DNA nuclease
MTALALQTLLLMLIAYFVGTTLACLVRRSLYRATAVPAERRVDPLPEYAGRDAGDATFVERRAPVAPLPPAAPAPAPVVVPAAPAAGTGAQDLKRIRLIDADTESRLRDLGIARYEQIAAWTRTDVQRIAQALGADRRIARENWIEQAQVLSKGGETYYSARRARGETATAGPTTDAGARVAVPAAAGELPRPMSRAGVAATVLAPAPAATAPAQLQVASRPLVSERAAFAASGPMAGAPPPATTIQPRSTPERDNLQRIGGITAEAEQALNAQGVSRYAQVSQWSAADIERFEGLLGSGGRIARENWIEQAHILSRGGDTRFSRELDGRSAFHPTKLADAIRVRKDVGDEHASAGPRAKLGPLRSVRSQAYRNTPEPGPEAAQRAASRMPAGPSGSNDLKRIRGIGVLIEKRLITLGVRAYEDIANWTASDIDRISQSLDFKGRIERENWVEQARILSAGGNTEFSRRVDRGEVETSRPKE